MGHNDIDVFALTIFLLLFVVSLLLVAVMARRKQQIRLQHVCFDVFHTIE